jgi:hypothetical protein
MKPDRMYGDCGRSAEEVCTWYDVSEQVGEHSSHDMDSCISASKPGMFSVGLKVLHFSETVQWEVSERKQFKRTNTSCERCRYLHYRYCLGDWNCTATIALTSLCSYWLRSWYFCGFLRENVKNISNIKENVRNKYY